MFDPRVVEVEIHEGKTAIHAVVTVQSPSGNGFLIIHATFEDVLTRKESVAYSRYRLINPVVAAAWERAQNSDTGYGSYWSYYLIDKIERWNPKQVV